jgi:Kef-type K+ transport system membrane component KefB/nucleotide-binding universal stress UspA family protein
MDGPFSAASHHDILVLMIQIAVLLLAARGLGEVARRLGQPSVVGEILAGIVLGPSLLSGLFPFLGQWIVPQTEVQGYLIEVIGLIGVMFLLLITGIETDIPLIRRQARSALGAAAGGLLLPFASGMLLGLNLPDNLLVNPDERVIFALFLAAAMSISAIPVIAKVLIDLDLMRRDIGQTIIAAGMVDDTTAWIILSIIIGIASGAGVTAFGILQSVGSVILFLIFSFTAGRWLVKVAISYTQDNLTMPDRVLTLVVVMAFGWGAITQAIGLEALFGAFIMGILFGQMPRLQESVIHKLESIALSIFAPVFFALAGLKVNIVNLFDVNLLGIGLMVLAVAIFGKVVGCYVGGRLIGGQNHWTALSIGFGLNARGAMEIIIATIGLNLGVLTQDMFSIIVLMAIITSLMAPPLLRWALTRIQPEGRELERLRREKLAESSLTANIHRVLLPVRRHETLEGSSIHTIEAEVLALLEKSTDLSVTLFSVAELGQQEQNLKFLNQLAKNFTQGEVTVRVVEHGEPAQAILDEVKKGYDLLVLGASRRDRGSEFLFTPLVDFLVRVAPCPTIVVKGARLNNGWQPRRILVPTNGSTAGFHAADMAMSLASVQQGGEVAILHVIVESESDLQLRQTTGTAIPERRRAMAEGVVSALKEVGDARGVLTETIIAHGSQPETVILDTARINGMDLIILGTDVRSASGRLYLGPRVERILIQAECPVIIVNASG